MPRLSQIEYALPENLTRFAAPGLPKDAKMVAARGMLPIPPADLIQVLFALSRDGDAEVSKTSRQSLLKMPENILKSAAENVKTHPLILDFLARSLDPGSKLQEAVALNRSTHDETISFQAMLPNKRVVDIISENQIRILRCPPIVDSLAENILTGQAQLERIIKFVEMETRKSAAAPAATGQGLEVEIEEIEEEEETIETVSEGPDDDVPTVTEEEEEIGAVTVSADGPSPWAAMTFDADLLRDHNVEGEDEEQVIETNLLKSIGGMKVSQKIKLALTGGQQARSILIKDANKMVSSAVLKSPRITDNEIDAISRSRSVSDEVMRMVSGNKEWTRSYQVKLNLVNNPKTPAPDAMRFMNFLRDKDLRDVSKSKSVPNNIASQAKRLLARKEQKGKPGAKKG